MSHFPITLPSHPPPPFLSCSLPGWSRPGEPGQRKRPPHPPTFSSFLFLPLLCSPPSSVLSFLCVNRWPNRQICSFSTGFWILHNRPQNRVQSLFCLAERLNKERKGKRKNKKKRCFRERQKEEKLLEAFMCCSLTAIYFFSHLGGECVLKASFIVLSKTKFVLWMFQFLIKPAVF